MGEFIVRKLDTYILMLFEQNDYMEDEAQVEHVTYMAHEMQRLNGGKTVVARIGNGFTLILDGIDSKLDMDKLHEVIQ